MDKVQIRETLKLTGTKFMIFWAHWKADRPFAIPAAESDKTYSQIHRDICMYVGVYLISRSTDWTVCTA
jgi:hypothetical protein